MAQAELQLDLVIFGGNGDLTLRKLLPALYYLEAAGLLGQLRRIVGVGRTELDTEGYRQLVAQVFEESATFRIDHYLGKETVQNLIALRFGNPMFSHLWNHQYIDDVQITVEESLGVEGRGSYYAEVGALRDMVQNHLLQILCLVAMEPPSRLDADAIRDEKVKVLTSLQGLDPHNIKDNSVSGQYTGGEIEGRPVPGCLDQPEYKDSQRTETFVALKAEVINWHWAGVPFYLRTGKRLAARYSEIVITFKPQVHSILPFNTADELSNQLVMRLQPEENNDVVQ